MSLRLYRRMFSADALLLLLVANVGYAFLPWLLLARLVLAQEKNTGIFKPESLQLDNFFSRRRRLNELASAVA